MERDNEIEQQGIAWRLFKGVRAMV